MKYVIGSLLSLVFPGFGQLYTKKWKEAVITWLVLVVLYSVTLQYLAISFVLFVLCIVGGLAIRIFLFLDTIVEIRRKKNTLTILPTLGLLIIGIVLISAIPEEKLVKEFRYQTYKIPSGSMVQTVNPGDGIVVDTEYYKEKKIERGDIVVYVDNNIIYISRCVAIDGDIIEIQNDELFINGLQQNDRAKYLVPSISSEDDETKKLERNYPRTLVKKDRIFILGDNRRNSRDSRYKGQIERGNISGKVLYIYISKRIKGIGNAL